MKKTPDKTPDIEIELDDRIFNHEVTSLNNPDEYKEKQEFQSHLINLQLEHKVKIAGNIIEIPREIQSNFLQKIENRIVEDKSPEEITSVEEILTIYLNQRNKIDVSNNVQKEERNKRFHS